MIPTLILGGLLVGAATTGRRGLLVSVGMVALASVGWGLVVGDLLAGAGLASVNLVVGLVLGMGVNQLGRTLLGGPART